MTKQQMLASQQCLFLSEFYNLQILLLPKHRSFYTQMKFSMAHLLHLYGTFYGFKMADGSSSFCGNKS